MKTRLKRNRNLLGVIDLTREDDEIETENNEYRIQDEYRENDTTNTFRSNNNNNFSLRKRNYLSSPNIIGKLNDSIYENGNNIYRFLNNKTIRNNNTKYYEAEAIIDKKLGTNGKNMYKLKWKGYPDEKSTWEYESDLENIEDMIKIYEHKINNNINNNNENGSGDEIEDIRLDSYSGNEENYQLIKKSKINNTSTNKNKKFNIYHQNNKDNYYTISSSSNSDSNSSDSSFHAPNNHSRKSSKSKIGSPYSNNDSESDSISDSDSKKCKSVQSKNSSNISNQKNTKGDIKLDKIKKIISARIINPENKELSCLVEFEQRPDAYQPEKRKYSSKVLRSNENGHIPLIDFLISRLSTNKYK